jgi:hypothetical protein
MTLITTPHSRIKALATDWVNPAYFDTFEEALVHAVLDIGERFGQMSRHEANGVIQYALDDDDWVTFEVVLRPKRWKDTQGDIWTLGEDGLLHTPETRPFPRYIVEKKWGPLRPME